MEAADGVKILGWVKEGFDIKEYRAVNIAPVVLVTDPAIDDRLDQDELQTLRESLHRKMVAEISAVMPVAADKGPGVLVLSLAISGVDAVDRDLRWFEYTPITYTASRIAAAGGARGEVVELWIEGKWTDGATGELLASAVRKGQSHGTVGSEEEIESADLDSLLQQWAESNRKNLESLMQGS